MKPTQSGPLKIVLCCRNSDDPVMQLAPYLLKAYFKKYTRLSQDQYDIRILTFYEEDTPEKMANTLLEEMPDVVGFSCYVWNVTAFLETARILKQSKVAPMIVMGGPEVSPRSTQVLEDEPQVDIVINGEGEETFIECIESFVSGADFEKILGLTLRKNGNVIKTDQRPDIQPLEKIPSPHLEGDVTDSLDQRNPLAETMRGCTIKCHFCFYHKDFMRMRYMGLERVEAEIKNVLASNPKSFYLVDPTFNIHPKRAKDILRLFIRYNRNTKLHLEIKAEYLDEEMVELLDRAQCHFIEIGLQSIHEKTLKAIHRSYDRQKFDANVRLLIERMGERNVQLQLIDTLPHETLEEFLESVNRVVDFRPGTFRLMKLLLLPGTFLREHAEDLGIEYDPNPPYEATRSSAMSAADRLVVDELRLGSEALYNNGLVRETVHWVKDVLDVNYTDIFLAFERFRDKNGYELEDLGSTEKALKHFFREFCIQLKQPKKYGMIEPVLISDLMTFFYKQKKLETVVR